MPFMTPEYSAKPEDWYEVETKHGCDLFPASAGVDLNELVTDTDESVTTITYHACKYGARLSASGYLDCTDWAIFDTLEEAQNYIRDTYDVDPETGEALGDEEESEEA